MNVTKYILATFIILATACNDTEYIEAPQLPVKSVLIDNKEFGSIIDIFTMNDGVAVKRNTDYDNLSFIIIHPDGTTTFTDPIPRFDKKIDEATYMKFTLDHPRNNKGELFVWGTPSEDEEPTLKVAKFDSDGHLIYNKEFNDIEGIFDGMACNNGNFVFFCQDYYEHSDTKRYVMRVIDQNGELRNYEIVLDFDLIPETVCFDDCLNYEDNILIINQNEYFIFKMDGSFVNSGEFEGLCVYESNAKYANGALYFMSLKDIWTEDYFGLQYYIHKIDSEGNLIFSKPFDVYDPSYNITINKDKLIVSGSVSRGNYDDFYGQIWLFNSDNGNLTDSITLNYNGNVMPYVINPASDGGYDVYLTRYKASDIWLKNENIPLYIYHTDDLRNIKVE
ncbi:MAG: hypothetical protein IKR94_10170 [Bacteroidales bacterium]|nr:hypothetical protein [Bacteroidales bacterium]